MGKERRGLGLTLNIMDLGLWVYLLSPKRTTGNLSSVDSTEFPGLVMSKRQKVLHATAQPYTFPGFLPVLSR